MVLRISLALLLSAGLAACAAPVTAPGDGTVQPLRVIASTSLIADVVAQIGGDKITVQTIVPLGADTHSFQPTPQDIAAVSDADLVFVNGLGYEAFLADLIANAEGGAEVIELSAGITPLAGDEHADEHAGDEHADEHAGDEHADEHAGETADEHAGETADEHAGETADEHAGETADEHAGEHDHGAGDPHVWTDPNNVMIWVDVVTDALSARDAANAAAYQAAAAEYRTQLVELDSWISEQFAAVPADRRLLVTDHTVFSYLAERYGLTQVGTIIPGASSAAAPSAQDLAALQDLIADVGINVIFVGDVASQSIAEQVAADTGIELVTILTESLAPAGERGSDYIDYMRSNVELMATGMQR